MNVDDPKLTAYALDELSGDEKSRVEAAVAESPEAQAFVEETKELAQMLKAEYAAESEVEMPAPANARKGAFPVAHRSRRTGDRRSLIDIRDDPWFWSIGRPLAIAAALALFAVISAVVVATYNRSGRLDYFAGGRERPAITSVRGALTAPGERKQFAEVQAEESPQVAATPPAMGLAEVEQAAGLSFNVPTTEYTAPPKQFDMWSDKPVQLGVKPPARIERDGDVYGNTVGAAGDDKSNMTLAESRSRSANFGRDRENMSYAAAPPLASPPTGPEFIKGSRYRALEAGLRTDTQGAIRTQNGAFNTASYDQILENPFLDAATNPLSTFSIDVDTASYSNIRRFINEGSLPPKDAVRIEEMINYFTYDYPQPDEGKPFSINVDVAGCPWEASHRLVRIGLKGREIATDKRGPSNLVFLLDVSGSMTPPERLPLVKQSMRLLVEKLTENDRVAIVVYAGASGLALPSTNGAQKEQILQALENLQPGGSTNGAEGIQLAYKIAADNFIKGGVNRVILATDGDFNIGVTNQGDLVRLIEEKARTGVFLSVLGVGTDNLKDSTMQKLADKGNGNYAYLDSLDEARKVLVKQMNGTLVTIAKDVKIQVEFNSARVVSYRLIGYEKRMLRKEDFNNDKVDAGEIGAGHTVTALYEVVPAGAAVNPAASAPPVDRLKYSAQSAHEPSASNEMLTVKLRHKKPDGDQSEVVERAITDRGENFEKASPDLKFAAAVAEFGMILRDSEHKGNGTLGGVLEWAQEGKGNDANGYRAGFIELVRKAQALRKG